MEKYDTSQLTEFPRFESESNPSGVSTFFNKLWKFPIFSPNETGENSENKPSEKQSEQQESEQTKQAYDDVKTEPASYAVEFEGRSLPNVLRRISSLVALGSGGGTRYADTELARYWMPDDISRECYECAARFGALRRRHHCRVCGQIFCSRCCSQRVPGQIFGCAGGLRVCNYCCNVVLSYLRENDMAGDISPDLRTLQENLQVKFPENRESSGGKSRDMFSREQDEREARACPREELHEALHEAFRQMVYTLPTQQHRYRLVRYIGVWRGCDLMQWVMDNTSHKTRSQATSFCQELVAGGLLEPVTEPERFADYALYRPARAPDAFAPPDRAPVAEECSRLVESVSSYCLDLNVGNSSARLIKATKPEPESSPSNEEEPPILDHSGVEEGAAPCRSIVWSGAEHLALLARQCLARRALPPAWLPTLLALCTHAADLISLDMLCGDMDVRKYVQVKKVAGGAVADSRVLPAVVLTKNVAHRGMPQQISNPTVLLLDCSIAYQRVEGKLTSLEPVLMQEQEYLVRCAARISALRPKVVLVKGGAARAVQDALRLEGVALAVGVGDRALRRAARCVRADLVSSIDARIGMPRLGTCKNFYVKNYGSKTLMVLEGCAEPQLGCCILLRGGSLQELIRVKKVVKFMLLACYNWKLEKAFLADIGASLPEPGTFDDDDDKDITDGIVDKENKTNADVSKTDKIHDNLVNEDASNMNISDEINDDVFGIKSNDTLDSDRVSNVSNDNAVNKSEAASSDENDEMNKNNESHNNDSNEEFKESDSNTDHLVSTESKTKVDDSAQKKPFARKTDSDKNLSCGVPIRDFSDPLQSRMSGDDEVFLPKEEAKLKADTHSERWCTDDVVLSMSPNIVIPAPPPAVPLARPAPPHTPRALRRDERPDSDRERPTDRVVVKETHPFIRSPLSRPADEPAPRAALAHYRAVGCRLHAGTHKRECPLYNPCVLKPAPEPGRVAPEPPDPLSPELHQRLALLVYSYSSKSPNVPDFCVNPWIVTMEMYGRHDIALGAFLEKYCFNSQHRCPASACHLPMNQHVRRFVHGDVCITITCNTVGHSNVDKPSEEQTKQVMFWSRCERCGKVSHGSRLSRTALCLSLAQYVRARVSAPRYARAMCPHPLNEHSHAFVSRHTTACFKYNKISTYDIQLPPDVISIQYDPKAMRDSLIAQLNDLVLKGHEIFSNVAEGEAEKEYQAFKQHMEGIHLALTSAHLHELATVPAVVRSLWGVSDDIIAGEKMLRDAQEKWAGPPGPTGPPPRGRPLADTNADDKFDSEDSSGDVANNETTDTSSKELEKEHTGGSEDEERGDRKTVKQILSQLLSNNQQQNQSGMIISSGLVPVVVRAGEVGSVIAATLASLTYQKTLRAFRHSNQTEQEEESGGAGGRDKLDGEKARAKANERYHVEVLLKDGLPCRVYYAPQFHKLRHMLLAPLSEPAAPAPPTASAPREHAHCCDDLKDKDGRGLCEIEEGFIRSLAHCVPWAARGGKSGSTFCKTKDDRYVLKEMTKPEWQQFLEFAPHYFNYVTACRQRAQPSLLARILGVFSVGGGGSGVLVVEHVWYARSARAPRFDLKGTSRPRLAAPAPAAPGATPTVLLDENLLRLRWETQLYVSSEAGAALWASVERDTQFLEDNHVMDYSLLLSIDDRTLVLGIIDYIRTFTWDKKLEHLVKKNLGSGQPTVLSPGEYRRRFAAAARKYFLHCPRHWDPLLVTGGAGGASQEPLASAATQR